MPAHKVAGQDFNKLWSDSIDISSGPFKFGSWQKGTQLTIVRNPAFNVQGLQKAKVDRIVFKYIAGASQFQALKSGEGDVVEPQPQIQIVDFYKDKSFKVDAGSGLPWEHIDFQQGAKAHPALKLKYVRQAFIQGINRAQIRDVLYIKTGLVANVKDLPVLQSNIYKPFERAYATPYARWKFSQKNVIALLKKNGCTGGPDKPTAGNSKIFSCPGVGKLSFAFTTTSGNPLRALTFEIIQKQLKSVGIELTPRFISPAVLFGGGTLTSGDWQIVLFTFIGGPTELRDVLRHRRLRRRPELHERVRREGVRAAQEGAVHGRRDGPEQPPAQGRGHAGGRRVLDPGVLAADLPAQRRQGQGTDQEPDPAGLDVERRDLEYHLVAGSNARSAGPSARIVPVPPPPLGGGGTSF